MELVFLLAFMTASVVNIVAHVNAYKNALPAEVEASSGPELESIDDILARHRRDRRNRRIKDLQDWEDLYFRFLPVTEHPDYFKLNPSTDEVEGFTQKSADGSIIAKFESRTSATGVPYRAKLDHVTKMIHVSTSRIFWSVPFSEVPDYQKYM